MARAIEICWRVEFRFACTERGALESGSCTWLGNRSSATREHKKSGFFFFFFLASLVANSIGPLFQIAPAI